MINKDMIEKDVYSLEEIRTNKVWIDSKPIYRRCYTDSNVKQAVEKSLPTGIENLQSVTNLYGFAVTTSQVIPMNFNNADYTQYKSILYLKTVGNKFVYQTKYTIVKVIIIMEYTKTTD